jgi:hypothetical protein
VIIARRVIWRYSRADQCRWPTREIEIALETRPSVERPAVTVDGHDSAARLVAYCVAPTAAVEGAVVGARLPCHTLPSALVAATGRPLALHGKMIAHELHCPG